MPESDSVALKKAHTKLMQKATKKMSSKVKSSLEKKQIIKAVKALKEYAKKVKQ